LLWAESSPEAARKNLRNTLWTIRKSLGDDVLHSSDDHLALQPDVWVDVREFEKLSELTPTIENLQTAIALYRGSLLEGFIVAQAPEFEIWLTAERERLSQLHSRLLGMLVDTYRVEGNWPQVIVFAQHALAHDNLQEPMYRALMEAHARLGERAEALRQYDTLQATLVRELDVEPLPETTALRAAIINGAFDQPMSVPATVTPRMPRRPPMLGDSPRPLFVGRQAERAALDEEFQSAVSGQARVVLLAGEVGIGKSRLWQEWSASLAPGMTMLESRCLEATQTLPFAPLIELFSNQACIRNLFTPPSPVPLIWLAEVARGRGDLDGALMLLETARASAASLTAPHLQTQIDLWLAELYLQRGERTAASQALARAEARLAGGERKRLKSQMSNLKSQISN
jgi:DNA-binding SARP family transcriptional activator